MNDCKPSSRKVDRGIQERMAGDMASALPPMQSSPPQMQQEQQMQMPPQSSSEYDPDYMLEDDYQPQQQQQQQQQHIQRSNTNSDNGDTYIRLIIAILFVSQLFVIYRVSQLNGR